LFFAGAHRRGPNPQQAGGVAKDKDTEPARKKMMPSNQTSVATDQPVAPEVIDIRHISVDQLARLGVAQIAYVKPVLMNGAPAYAIHAADGTPMAIAEDRDVALAAIRQHEMLPTLVH
jgi:hypothetical protein